MGSLTGLDSSNESDKKWSTSECMLKIETTEFSIKLNMWSRGQGVKNGSKIWGLSTTWKDGAAIY